jgi:hypothetical protein
VASSGVPLSSGAFFMPPGHSFRLPGILGDEEDGARDDSWRGCFMVSLLGNKVFPHEGWMWMG